jgi:hypothetical protein
MVEVAFGLWLLFSILLSGFFLWIGIRIMGKKRGILKAGLANLAAGIFAFVIVTIVASIPILGMFFPIAGYLAYLYALKAVLDLSLIEAFLASMLASIAFVLLSMLVAMLIGIWFFKFAAFPQVHF